MKKKQLLLLFALVTVFTACSSCDDEENAQEEQGEEIRNSEQEVFEAVDLGNPNTALSTDVKSVLARVKVSIKYELEQDFTAGAGGFFDDTRIYIRSVKCSGFALKGSLKKSSIASGHPVWKDYDGQDGLSFNPMVFHDGRKDGKEGSLDGEQGDEPNLFLNPALTENNALVNNGRFASEKNPGINEQEQPVFKFSSIAEADEGFYYVIPRHQDMGIDFDVSYYIETIDPHVPGLLTDGDTHGILIEDHLSKSDLLGKDTDFEPGKSYLINIVVGAEAPKIEATTLQ